MGPEAVKSHPGQRLLKAILTDEQPGEWAKREIDSGRREKGYIYGAFRPASGEAFTAPFPRWALENTIPFLRAGGCLDRA